MLHCYNVTFAQEQASPPPLRSNLAASYITARRPRCYGSHFLTKCLRVPPCGKYLFLFLPLPACNWNLFVNLHPKARPRDRQPAPPWTLSAGHLHHDSGVIMMTSWQRDVKVSIPKNEYQTVTSSWCNCSLKRVPTKSNYLIILHHGFTTLGVQFLKKRNTFSWL